MILEQELKGKTLSPQEVRSILKTDNKEIVELCKRASILPRKNSKGQTYFSYEEVKNLRKVQAMKGLCSRSKFIILFFIFCKRNDYRRRMSSPRYNYNYQTRHNS
jgi:hypothetical protein